VVRLDELGLNAVKDYTEEKRLHAHNGPRTSWLLLPTGAELMRSAAAARPLETAPDRIRRESDDLEG
jgi:hypothetical protein